MLSFALLALLAPGPEPAAPPRRPASKPQAEAPGEALLREAKSLRYGQRFYEAAAAYRRFLAEYPGSSKTWEARFWLAATLEQDQRWDEAAAAYTEFLARHPDQGLLGKEARLNRVRCWGIRQGQHPEATPGLVSALADPIPEIRVAAALQLAKTGDRRGVDILQQGLGMSSHADACSLALIQLGVKPQPVAGAPAPRYVVIRIQEAGKKDAITIRLAATLARAVENYLSDAQVAQAQKRGIHLDHLTDKALELPKGSVLLSVDDGKSKVTVTVE